MNLIKVNPLANEIERQTLVSNIQSIYLAILDNCKFPKGLDGIIVEYYIRQCHGCYGGKLFFNPIYLSPYNVEFSCQCILECSQCHEKYLNRPMFQYNSTMESIPFISDLRKPKSISYPWILPVITLDPTPLNLKDINDKFIGTYTQSVLCSHCGHFDAMVEISLKWYHGCIGGDDDFYLLIYTWNCTSSKCAKIVKHSKTADRYIPDLEKSILNSSGLIVMQ